MEQDHINHISNEILEASLDGFFLLDVNGVISKTNNAYCEMVGYLKQELIGMSIADLDADMTPKEVEMKIASVTKNGSDRFETRQKCKDGSIIEIEVSTQLCEIGSDKFFPVFVRDITKQKQVISQLHKNQERLSLGVEIANLGYLDRDIKTETHYWSDQTYRIFGCEPQEFAGSIEKFLSFVHPDDKERIAEKIKKTIIPKEVREIECRIIRKDGIVRKVRTLGKTFFDSDGKAARVVATIQDVTEITDHMESLSKSEEMYRTLITNIPDATWTVDANGKFKFISPNIESVCGYKPEDYYKSDIMSWMEKTHPDDRKIIKNAFNSIVAGDEPFDVEYRLLNPNGQWIWLHNRSITAYEKDGIRCADGLLSNVTDRKEIEDRLQESESKYRMLFERSADAIFLVRNGKNIDCNQAALDMMGYTSVEELFGTHPSQLSPEKQPDGRSSFEKANELMSIAVERGCLRFEWNHKRKNGEVFPVEVLLTSIPLAGKELLHVVLRDITDRVNMLNELSEYKDRVLRSQRQSYINTLGGMVAHELNQPLTAINLLLGSAVHRMETSDELCCEFVRQDILKSLDEAGRSVGIIKKFRRLCENTSVGLDKPANVIKVANKIIHIMSVSAELANIKINISSSGEIPGIGINEFVIEQIFLTIIQNAIDASDRTSEHQLQISIRKVSKKHVELTFADDCGGIDPANIGKIFQPFFTTKKDNKGMGLGLEIVKQMLITSHGDIRVESEFGKGATFYLTLPVNV